jgi:hypothetical protein
MYTEEQYAKRTKFHNLRTHTLFSGLLVLLVLIWMLATMGCAGPQMALETHRTPKGYHHTTKARITYYTGRHEKRAMDGKKAIQGETVAAHPQYHFGEKIIIPELKPFLGDDEFTIQDRGRDVTRRKASHGKADVFDIFVKNYATMKKLEKQAQEYMTVELLKTYI